MASRNHLEVSKLHPQEQDLQKTLFPTSHRFRHRSPFLRRKHQMIELLNADFFDSKTYQNISSNSMINFGFFISLKTFSPRPQSMETFCQVDSLDPDAVSNYNWETHTRRKGTGFQTSIFCLGKSSGRL